MHSNSQPSELPAGVSLQDLLEDRCGCKLTEYLSVSVVDSDNCLCISLTTTHKEPVTYSTEIFDAVGADPLSLLFIVQNQLVS